MDRAVQVDVLAAGEVRVEAGAELQQRGDATAGLDAAGRRLDDPGDQAEQRRLARAVSADRDRPPRPARPRARRPRARRTSVAPAPLRAKTDFLERAHRLRVDAEVARRPSTRSRPVSYARGYCQAPAAPGRPSARTNAGSAFGISIRASPMPERAGPSPPPRCRGPSGSRGGRRRTRPGRRARSRPPGWSAARWSRMSGPSQGSPVGDSVWNENDHSPGPRPAATSCDVSSSCPRYGSPSSTRSERGGSGR